MILKNEKQGGPIPTGPKRLPLKLIKHLADTSCVSPTPADTAGCSVPSELFQPFEYRLQMSSAYSRLDRTKALYATSLVLLVAKAKFLREGNQVSSDLINARNILIFQAIHHSIASTKSVVSSSNSKVYRQFMAKVFNCSKYWPRTPDLKNRT